MNRVRVRTMAVACLLGLVGACAHVDHSSGVLIDGSGGMDNWTPLGVANWRAQDGVIQADGMTGNAGGYLVSKGHYGDFRLHVEFWVSPDAKSGIFLRCADPQTFTSRNCYEVQIYDQRPEPRYRTGSIVNVADTSTPMLAGGRWNTCDITAQGAHLKVVLNGVQTVDVQDGKLVDGRIVLQYRGGVVRFRSVRIGPL
ncbi:3-keto-disaccharide hydrolase [Paraburkholderia saeva]|uniref:3-keto-alpha-glucoside-1,2-lyase/3-keto-2-hydroxy-glucal hydratase domain-containing protein n=1 Tax=Paraburkholderia saeva TaxID=2777537 RepID=A0A9N8RS38_9BURK|nr:DUF1080 domain-containing protein [Paraburkholderia saeva]CAG4887985.1 hypothetical protein LMG31841_00558 [Paraburkholderia saeva]CAG4901555.1 hypothetical protein R70241_02876 [Paraburkholderia saeva]